MITDGKAGGRWTIAADGPVIMLDGRPVAIAVSVAYAREIAEVMNSVYLNEDPRTGRAKAE